MEFPKKNWCVGRIRLRETPDHQQVKRDQNKNRGLGCNRGKVRKKHTFPSGKASTSEIERLCYRQGGDNAKNLALTKQTSREKGG